MGQSESSFKRTYEETVSELSSVQLGDIAARFNELYAKAGGSKGHVVDKEAFSKYFNLPVTVGDRLFDAFDGKKNGKISFEEFVCGLAVVLHGSFHDRCALLFSVFNIHGDEGISRTELTTMLSAILQSTDTILYTVGEGDAAVMGGEDRTEAVRIMVDRAFKNCDITRTGKLLPLEFEYWLKRNPKVLDTLLSFNTREEECTLGQLIMSPSEQKVGGADQIVGVPVGMVDRQDVLKMEPSSPVLFEIEPKELSSLDTTMSDQLTTQPASQEPTMDQGTSKEPTMDQGTSKGPTPVISKGPIDEDIDSGSCLMEEATPLVIDMSCVTKVTSSEGVGPESPVLPTTSLESVCEGDEGGTNSDDNVESEMTSYSYDELRSDAVSGVRVRLTTSVSEPDDESNVAVPTMDETSQSVPNVDPVSSAKPYLEESVWEGVNENVYSAWIPSPTTAKLLSQSQPTMQRENLTCPALVADITISDPIGDLLTTHFPDAKRMPLLSVDNVSMDVDGLRKLVVSGCYHSALVLTSMFLSAHGQGLGQAGQPTLHTHKTLQMWSARLSLMVHLKMYKEAESELSAFGELVNPDLYYQYHPNSYPGRKGSLVPFTMRLLHAQLPSLTGDHHVALDRLCTLKNVCTQILDKVSHGQLPGVPHPLESHDQQVASHLWQNRLVHVTFSLGNVLVSVSDYYPAAQVYESILDLCPSATPYIYSGLGRLYLDLGDLQSSQKYFSKVASIVENDSSKAALVLINDGLINVFQSRWQAVRDCFTAALNLDPGNMAIQANITVCTFYLGRLKESIEGMEQLLTSDPPRSLQPAVFANLAAAYELESGQSLERKLNFVPVLGSHTCEGFQLQALNIR